MSGLPPSSGLSPGRPIASRRRDSRSVSFEMTSRGDEAYGSDQSRLHPSASMPSPCHDQTTLAPRNRPSPPRIITQWDSHHDHRLDDDIGGSVSPIDPAALQFALPPEIRQPSPPMMRGLAGTPDPYDNSTPYYDEQANNEGLDSDVQPLTSNVQPIAGSSRLSANDAETYPRGSFQTVSSVGDRSSRDRDTKTYGMNLEPTTPTGTRRSYGASLTPEQNRRSRSPSTSDALYRAGSMMRAMSQRVVNISGEGERLDHRTSQHRSRPPSEERRREQHDSVSMMMADTSYPSQVFPESRDHQNGNPFVDAEESPPLSQRRPMANPLKGKSLGIFSPDSFFRRKLCDLLVHPITEPLILCLIIAQTVLLLIESAPSVFDEGYERPERWGSGNRPWIDWAMLGLFIVFTLEIIVRVIVSGFILNPSEYSTIDRKKGMRAVLTERYQTLFQPERQKSVKAPRQINLGPSAFARSFTFMQGQSQPHTVEEHQRFQLARRAFLRHGFNRVDFVAVVSYWISFALAILGVEAAHQFYVFRMISALRLLRLLAITNGTAIILRSLKKAAPLLVRIAFLISFFWLLFAIIGVQSFKASLSRTCVYPNPDDPTNREAAFVYEEQFCGGHLDPSRTDGAALPWVFARNYENLSIDNLERGSRSPKGYICPRGSLCLQGENPSNGTVSFDNIFQSLEMVFVIMSTNTFTDIMYFTTNSDYLPAALFFAAGNLLLMLWLINLLIAVITSSFQIIREENRASAFTTDQEPVVHSHDEKHVPRSSKLQAIYDRTKWLWIAIIVAGLVAQCFRSATMSAGRREFIDVAESIVTIALDVEIAVRFIADWRAFHQKKRNLVDLFLAVATSIILIPQIRHSGQTYAWLTIFQILRIYRVVLAVPMTGKLIRRVLGNAAGIGNLILFVFLMTLIMAILASQLFRGVIDNDANISFFNVYNSFQGMYQIVSSENWTEILYNVTAALHGTNSGWIGAIFLIGWFVLAYFLLMNMFIAVIQENFDVSEDEKRLEQVKAFLQKKEVGNSGSNLALSTIFTLGRSRRKKDPLDYGPAMMEMLLKDAVVRDFLDDPADEPPRMAPVRAQTLAVGEVRPGTLSKWWGRLVARILQRDPNPFYSNTQFQASTEALDPRQMARQVVSATSARRRAQREYLLKHPRYNTSLYMFGPKNFIRRACQKLVGPGRGSERIDGVEPNKIAWYVFSIFIYACVVAMVVIACVTTPLYQKEFQEEHRNSFPDVWYVWTDTAFAVIFTLEALIKVIADGAFFTPHAYYRSSWGAIDGIVLITLWINVFSLFLDDGNVSRAIGAFKALRALRLLNVSDSARDTFHSLIIVGGWNLLSAAFVSVSLLIPFAIYGLNLFNGLMASCNDDKDGTLRYLSDCYGEFESGPINEDDWPMLAPRVVANSYFNFDNFGNSILIFFSILSQEGWTDVSFASQSITGRGLQPRSQASPGNGLFFIAYNLLGTVFVLALFIAVFMRNYTEQTGVAFLTAEQRSWLELRKLLRHISPSKTSYDDSEKKWKKWCHKRAIEKRGKWYQTVTFVLVCHLILLLLEYRDENIIWSRIRDFVFLIFVFIYIAHVIIRMVGLGWSRFRRSSWDMYSLVVVVGAFASTTIQIILRATGDDELQLEGEAYVQIHKSFLVAILFLLIPRNDALDQLFKTAAASLTTIGNLLATWAVFFVVFAIALTQAFSLTRFGNEASNHINFRTVPHALILLFRMSNGEGWNGVMEDYADIEPPFCNEGDTFFESDCGSKAWARILFITWNIISMYIFVNLFVSLIYESFSYVYQRSSGIAAVDRDEIRRFKEAWRSVDPSGSGFISKEQFPQLLGELSGVFQMRIYDPEDSVRRIVEDVRQDASISRHASIGTTSAAYSGLDVQRLNERINQIDIYKVRERRRQFNLFYEEVMVSADPDRGIAFGEVLMILAHYNIIRDSKSLRLEEFLRRRARLQRVDEEVRRRIVLGFFDTLYYSRQFKRHMERKRAGRMTAVPQLDIPDIFVDEGEESSNSSNNNEKLGATAETRTSTTAMLSAHDAARRHDRSWSVSTDAATQEGSPYQHPLAAPFSTPSSPVHQASNSGYSFDVQDPGFLSRPTSGENSRRTSAVSPAQLSNMLDDSAWMESIRRSATVRRPDWSNH